MEIAARWFTQPWRIAGGSRLLWYARAEAVREAEIKRSHRLAEQQKQAQDMRRKR